MAFCPVCKRNHDPDISCTDGTSQTLREMGIKEAKPKINKEEFRKLSKKATIQLIIIAVAIMLLFVFVISQSL